MPISESLKRAQKKYKEKIKELVKKGEIEKPLSSKKALENYLNKPDKFKQFREYQLKYYREKVYYSEDSILRSIRKLFI
jgi:Skp family chaperone for outer membrane proteins